MISIDKYKHLIVDLSTHIAVTLIVSFVIFKIYLSFTLVALVVTGGILIDVDHFIDYFLYAGLKFNLKKFALIDFLKSGKVYLFFHSWELIVFIYIIGSLLGVGKYSLALSSGMLGHLLVDSIFQKTFLPYSLFYRIWYNFDANKILPCFKKKMLNEKGEKCQQK